MMWWQRILYRIFCPAPVSFRAKQGGWVALVGVGLSALEANYSNNQRKNAQNQSNTAESEAAQLEKQQLQEGNQLYNRYQTVFQPAQDKFITASENTLNPEQEAGQAIAGVQQASDVQRGVAERQLARLGIRPDSGAWLDMERRNALGTTAAEAGAGTSARRYAAAENLRRLGVVANMGNDLLAAGTGMQRDGTNFYQNKADQYGQIAGGYGKGVGAGLTGAMYWLNKYENPNQNSTSGRH